jgi:deoxyribodipyrimidine photo-lyase
MVAYIFAKLIFFTEGAYKLIDTALKFSTVFWFRRDLRLEDNTALRYALAGSESVQPLFIFDTDILDKLDNKADRRVDFIHSTLEKLQEQLVSIGSSLLVIKGKPIDVFKELLRSHDVKSVYANHDYEPYAIKRDEEVKQVLDEKKISFFTFKDQVIFEKREVCKNDGTPYTVFTPYSRKWKSLLTDKSTEEQDTSVYFDRFIRTSSRHFPSLEEIGFSASGAVFPDARIDEDTLKNYETNRNIPALNGTSHIGLHLRFGTISVRKAVRAALQHSEIFLNELIWREFFMMILWNFPHVAKSSFRSAYDAIQWRNEEEEFAKWCRGETGYPMVDAGMRELLQTGYMHNRVRMVVASFLCKHLLIDWRWGEAWFAAHLLDYELSSNNGNWQWAAGSGCDAAPYFRVFNPSEQAKKFDPQMKYILKWVPEYGTSDYAEPMVEHRFARERALKAYGKALGKKD